MDGKDDSGGRLTLVRGADNAGGGIYVFDGRYEGVLLVYDVLVREEEEEE